jgi:futalosine hydrolase
MKILLCAATEMEIAPTIQYFTSQRRGAVEVVITGVGLMTSTYALTRSVVTHQPDLIIQAGIAGTLDLAMPLGTVVTVQHETIGDLGVLENGGFRSLFDLKLLGRNIEPWVESQLSNDETLLNQTGLPVVNGVTVNEISTDEQTIGYYRDSLNTQIETMEGAALHYVGLMEKIPFLQVRSLSNFIGERDKSKWMIKKAITELNKELQKQLTNYLLA